MVLRCTPKGALPSCHSLTPGPFSCPSLSSKAACLRGHKEQGELWWPWLTRWGCARTQRQSPGTRLHEYFLPLSFLPLAVFFTCHFLLSLPEYPKPLTKQIPLSVQGDHHYHSSQHRPDNGDKGVSLTLTPWAAWQGHQCS